MILDQERLCFLVCIHTKGVQFDLDTKSFIISRDVRFRETVFPFKGAKDDMEDIFCVVPPSLFSGDGHVDAADDSEFVSSTTDIEASLPPVPTETHMPLLEATEIIAD